MLETLFSHKAARARHIAAPLRFERESYLLHLQQKNTPIQQIRGTAAMLLNVIEYLPLNPPSYVEPDAILQANRKWTRATPYQSQRKVSPEISVDFRRTARGWLRFLGLLYVAPKPYGDRIAQFTQYLAATKGLNPRTIKSCDDRVSLFLRWTLVRRRSLSLITLKDVEEYITVLRSDGLSIQTIIMDCQRLRTFFQYVELMGWNDRSIAAGIPSPVAPPRRIESRGPRWRDVRKLLSSCNTLDKVDLRARAVIFLCAIYGLRGIEVLNLTLDNFDWIEECFTVKRAKNGRIQRFPLRYEVGEAILDYIIEGRLKCATRNLFVTLSPPHGPLSQFSLRYIIETRLKALGIQAPQYSTHGLRHSCATQLLHKGISWAEIADLLGHSNTRSIGIYAKPSAASICQVSRFSLGGIH